MDAFVVRGKEAEKEENTKETRKAEETRKKKPECKYGSKCYRKNADHLRDFHHRRREEEKLGSRSPEPKRAKLDDHTPIAGTIADPHIDEHSDSEPPVSREQSSEGELSRRSGERRRGPGHPSSRPPRRRAWTS